MHEYDTSNSAKTTEYVSVKFKTLSEGMDMGIAYVRSTDEGQSYRNSHCRMCVPVNSPVEARSSIDNVVCVCKLKIVKVFRFTVILALLSIVLFSRSSAPHLLLNTPMVKLSCDVTDQGKVHENEEW
jgi:hypothetical protein